MSDLFDDCPDDAYLDYPMMCSGRITEIKEAKMDEKVREIEKKILNYEQDEPNSDEEVNSRYMGLKYWCKVLLIRVKELEDGIEKHCCEYIENHPGCNVRIKINTPDDEELYKLIEKGKP